MAIFQIPDRYIPGFEALVLLSTEQVKGLAKVLNSLEVGANEEDFTQLLLSAKNSNIKDAASLAQTIFSLGSFLTSQQYPLERIAKELSLAYEEESEDKISKEDIRQLEEKLLLIFSQAGSFKQTFKALGLLTENERNFREAKIISDIRLIFNEDITDKNRQAIVVHRLKIEYQQNDSVKEFYASLDSSDLANLKKQIDRAIDKENQIKKSYLDIISFIELK